MGTPRVPRRGVASPKIAPGRRPTPLPLEILYEDEALIALAKPAGLLVVPDRFEAARPTLFDAVWHLFFSRAPERGEEAALPRLVHRLDKGTSGVVVFAKSYEAQRALSRAFEQGAAKKRYLALVVGTAPEAFVVDRPLAPLKKKKGLMAVDPSGKPSRTRFRRLEQMARHALLEAFPETGRQHQIRVHLASEGLPLAFDPPYRRAPAEWKISEVCSRFTLHAASLTLPHPLTQAALALEAPLPEDLARAIEVARTLG